jgi:DNA-binding SARP family transcriptional activator
LLEVKLLGKFEVKSAGQPVEIPLRAAQSLLAYLMLDAGVPHRREQLAGLFWPDMSDSKAKSNLRQTLSRLRKAIGEQYLVADDLTIAFDETADYRLDARVLDRKAEANTPTADLIETVSVYGGELLPGFYDEWVQLERERLQAAFEHKMTLLLDQLVEAQRWEEVLEWGERWIALGQTPEAAYRALINAHGARGDVSSAAAVYQRCEEALRRNLGVEPSPQTRAARLLAWADVTRDAVDDLRPPVEQADVDRDLTIIRAQLDDATFQAEQAAGHMMTQDEAIAYALSEV